MLNSNNTRCLCYLVKVDDIKPIEGRDRVECAVVNGWTVMVRKGIFKPGDLGVYFEIDSQVPAKTPFEFLEAKHYKIKTQKYKTPSGQFWSQGLLMHPNDFGWESYVDGDGTQYVHFNGQSHSMNDDSRFLDKELGVTYAVAEDNVRKANSVDKYKTMAQRHGKLFAHWPFRQLMRHNWGKKLLFVFFGKKKDIKRTWPSWVVKTDEERCLPGGSKVLTEQGWIQINKIVNQTLPVKVASMNPDGSMCYKRIIDYQKFQNSTAVKTIHYPYAPDCERTNALCCTLDHKILTQRGYVKAKDLTLDDNVYMPIETYSEEVLPIVYGMLLGDSYIADDKRSNGMLRVVATNGEKQIEYLKYKASLFENDGKIVNAGLGSFSTVPNYHWFMNTDAQISVNIRKDWYRENTKKVTKEVCDKLTAASLAFWYMDDGCLSYRNDMKTTYFIRLNTQGFSLEENQLLVNTLCNKFNIVAKVSNDKIAADGHQMYKITIGTKEECNKFFNLIAPYICDSMLYKLPEDYQNRTLKILHFTKSQIAFPLPILSIENGQTKNKTWSKNFQVVYDLEIEDNHNFVADNIIVHNCQNEPWVLQVKSPWIVSEKIDGTSTTFTMRRQPHRKHKYDYYVCSRNVVFDKPDKPCFYNSNVYLEMSEKYHIENVLKDILDKNPQYEWVTLQGETYGDKIQQRDYSLAKDEHKLACFNFITSTEGRWNSCKAANLMAEYNIPWVPIINADYILPDTIDELMDYSTGISVIDGKPREGYVFRSQDGTQSFKCVSNSYLEKYHS